MNAMTTNDNAPAKIRKFIAKYIHHDEVSNFPAIMGKWSETLPEFVRRATENGCIVREVSDPCDALEVVGKTTRFLIRDHSLARRKNAHGNTIVDQWCSFEHDSRDESWSFIDTIVEQIKLRGNSYENLSDHYDSVTPDRVRRFICRSETHSLICVVAVTDRFSADNRHATYTFLHWTLTDNDASKR